MTLDELTAEFDALPDWEDRCDLLIDLGLELPPLRAEEKNESTRVRGCQSNVWLVADVESGVETPVLHVRAQSDAMIVNGLITVLLAMYDGKSARDVLEIDPAATFRRLDLDQHLSSQRKNGLNGMVQRIRQLAASALVAQAGTP